MFDAWWLCGLRVGCACFCGVLGFLFEWGCWSCRDLRVLEVCIDCFGRFYCFRFEYSGYKCFVRVYYVRKVGCFVAGFSGFVEFLFVWFAVLFACLNVLARVVISLFVGLLGRFMLIGFCYYDFGSCFVFGRFD